MLKQALRELRFHPSRFVATVIAIAISVAFMVGSSVLVASEQNGVERQQSLPIAGADLIVTSADGADQRTVGETLLAVEGVVAAEPSRVVQLGLRQNGRTALMNLVGLPSEPFRWSSVQDGRWPETDTEIVLTRGAAKELDVGIGGTVDAQAYSARFTVVGLTGEPSSMFLQTGYLAGFGQLGFDPAEAGLWLVKAAPGTDLDGLAARVKAAFVAGDGTTVMTAAEARADALSGIAGDFDVFRNLLWSFAAVAAVVGMITIANTFTILLAQRRRQIGLLRAVGASGRQVRRRFFLESLLLGLVGSATGVLLGIAIAAIGAAITGSLYWGLRIPATDVAIAFTAGVVITVLAAYLPVLKGTRVRPLEALQPEPSSDEKRRGSLVRAIVCGLLVAVGLVISLVGLDGPQPMLTAIAGAALTAVGVLFAAPLFVPLLLRGLSALVEGSGVTARLAGQNAVRNPRRASTTATALMLAVGLIVTLQVGTATVRATLLDQIDATNPVDIAIYSWDYQQPIAAEVVARLAGVAGIEAVAPLDITTVDLARDGQTYGGLVAIGYSPDMAGVVANPPTVGDDRVLVNAGSDAKDGDQATLTGPSGTVTLSIAHSQLVEGGQVMVSPATLAALGGVVSSGLVWLSVPDRSQAVTVMGTVSELVDPDVFAVFGGVVTAAQIETVLDLLLVITSALLAVAVIIALIGVSNTLGLSVLERTRESALMRALGLQARSLRLMLLIEALLLAGVGVLVGIVAGVFFGWLGAAALAGSAGATVRFAVDLPLTGAMVVVAIVAAALASLLPGRRAAKAAPVEALADI